MSNTIMIKLLTLLTILTACDNLPTTFPQRICSSSQTGHVVEETCTTDNMSPMRAGVSCHSMALHSMGCTEWDGHHIIDLGTLGIFPTHITLSDLGATFGQIGPWHSITEAQSATWCEDRCND